MPDDDDYARRHRLHFKSDDDEMARMARRHAWLTLISETVAGGLTLAFVWLCLFYF
jgi:hypothetical protein